MKQLAAVLVLVPLSALAETAMSGEEFDAYTRGHTFYYGAGGTPYGGEEYLDNRRVRWSFLDGECQEGYWYEAGELICFVYENNPDPQCWTFERSSDGLSGRPRRSSSRTARQREGICAVRVLFGPYQPRTPRAR